MQYQIVVVLVATAAIMGSYILGYTPPFVGITFGIVSLIAFYYYAKDKKAAVNGDWRVSENTLHILALCCGWPGALIAQTTLRHKTKKLGFRVVFWFTLLVNVSAFAWLHSSQGNAHLRNVSHDIRRFTLAQTQSTNIMLVTDFLTHYRPKRSYVY
ncbi:DUF1294 domain-containing protein [Paraglaciecola hydrolytica]|uniref:Cold-shock protein n=1 Tax=Paraglaciecola hydrolytica TaxID=1799789 RepID=A0A136A1P3_9ALTE|nr:DUF1294 domain-containing protein [Paraglaciecola hydrolytica]KXI29168.1 hypothetical protein AX660_13535 [Paraglaciecola hydrolytica]